jgi:uncharacterized protein YbjT (DUF2867 family)
MNAANPGCLVLVLGASGYIGGRLVPRLLDAGYRVRCLARSPQKLSGLPWADEVEMVQGDLLDRENILPAFEGVQAVYHLVHSMGSAREFADADRRIARHVASAAESAGVQRIVYLGGLGEVDADTSAHLRSRAEVGDILQASTVPTTVLRAAIVIGSGSASFEMLRHLVDKLPVMITPRWVNTRTQPIAVRDVLRYLVGVLDDESGEDHVFDVGGPVVMTYLDMMRTYARVAGLPPRLVLQVPVLTPRLSSHWVNLVTPVPFGLAQPLIESLASEVVVRRDGEQITDLVPGPTLSYEQALRAALKRIRDREVETSWRDADLVGRSSAEPYPGDPDWTGGTLLRDVRSARSAASPDYAYATVGRIGGRRGWPTYGWAWRIRGRLDRLIGGVGLRRGRRDPDHLRIGDALDFWRVEEVRQGAPGEDWVLRLRAEMRLPGRAWLEFRIIDEDGESRITQRALFAPKGLFGRLYWWLLLPFHRFIFASMVVKLARDAEGLAASGVPLPRVEAGAEHPPPIGLVDADSRDTARPTSSGGATWPPPARDGRGGARRRGSSRVRRA